MRKGQAVSRCALCAKRMRIMCDYPVVCAGCYMKQLLGGSAKERSEPDREEVYGIVPVGDASLALAQEQSSAIANAGVEVVGELEIILSPEALAIFRQALGGR